MALLCQQLTSSEVTDRHKGATHGFCYNFFRRTVTLNLRCDAHAVVQEGKGGLETIDGR